MSETESSSEDNTEEIPSPRKPVYTSSRPKVAAKTWTNGSPAPKAWATRRSPVIASSHMTPRSAEGRRMPSYSEVSNVEDFEGSPQKLVTGHGQSNKVSIFPAVVPLNVGGVCYLTRLSTLTKDPESMLAAMFSGRHDIERDKHGYYFIDTNGAYFGFILDYLRHGKLPPNDIALPVFQEARYFGLTSLQEALSLTPSVVKETVRLRHEDQFLNYQQFKQEVILTAMDQAVTSKVGEILVWAHRTDMKGSHGNCVAEQAHIKVGPWSEGADEETLMRSLHADLCDSGFVLMQLEKKRCKWYVGGQTCSRISYKLIFNFS